ncbi:hypothetical protein FNF27_05777 [Cafeteria roenbergensis]|uniref:SAYSvFN domain-containing protein n=2 Tax=Cafeteria roenbergensis TaxID=33653 RepID=A0A5A8E754_CAFRO|nr:hypothetical protein FNF27_05777 [Cafeteria roenbergensis]
MFPRIVDGEVVYDEDDRGRAAAHAVLMRRGRPLEFPRVVQARPSGTAAAAGAGAGRAGDATSEVRRDGKSAIDTLLEGLSCVGSWALGWARWDVLGWAAFWGGSLWLLQEFWPLWLLSFVLFITWACSKHGKRTLEDGLSAYSVFNPGHVRLHGTLTAEDLQSQMSGLIPRPGGADDGIDEALERQAEAQEAAELQAAMEASLRDF